MIDIPMILDIVKSNTGFLAVLLISTLVLIWQNWYFKNLKQQKDAGSVRFKVQLSQVLLTLIILLFILATLPIREELRAQLFSLFGLLISAVIALSSTTLVGNLMAGLMLRNIDSFTLGDFIRFNQVYGRVSDIGLLHVEIQDENRALVCIPNMQLISGSFQVTLRSGAMINCTVTLGYDVPHSLIERLLLEAAEEAGFDDATVLITDLGDYSIAYKLIVKLEDVKLLLTAPSRLRARVLDVLHAQGVEIASPTLMNNRAFDPSFQYIPQGFYGLKDEQAFTDSVLETLAFDIAETADNLARIKQLLQRNKEKTQEVEQALHESRHDPEEKLQIQAQLNRLQQHKLRLEKVLEKLKQQHENNNA